MNDPDLIAQLQDCQDEVARLERYRSLGQIPRLDLLLAENERLRDLLGRLEWAGFVRLAHEHIGDPPACPICGSERQAGHRPHCWLAKELGR
jgi:hypothetical protein